MNRRTFTKTLAAGFAALIIPFKPAVEAAPKPPTRKRVSVMRGDKPVDFTYSRYYHANCRCVLVPIRNFQMDVKDIRKLTFAQLQCLNGIKQS